MYIINEPVLIACTVKGPPSRGPGGAGGLYGGGAGGGVTGGSGGQGVIVITYQPQW